MNTAIFSQQSLPHQLGYLLLSSIRPNIFWYDFVKTYKPTIRQLPIKDSIAVSDVINWDNWSKDISISAVHWGVFNGYFECTGHGMKYISNLCQKTTYEDFVADITEITGLCNSKSTISQFKSLDDFAIKNCNELLTDISSQGLAEVWQHSEIRIKNKDSSDYFSQYSWNHRLFLMQNGGSHHFAAARYIAAKLGKPFIVSGKLDKYTINYDVLNEFLCGYSLFLIPSDSYSDLHDCLKYTNTPCTTLQLPKEIQDTLPTPHIIIRLSNTHKRAGAAADILRKNNFFDFKQFLKQQLNK